MRVDCPDCNQAAVVTSSNKISSFLKELDCQCMNTRNCGGSFVATVAFKHYLNPSVHSTRKTSSRLLRGMPAGMRAECPDCNQAAVVTSSNKISSQVKDLYCRCINTPNCAGSFVATVAFKRYLNPPINSTQEMAAALLRGMPAVERRELLQDDFFQ